MAPAAATAGCAGSTAVGVSGCGGSCWLASRMPLPQPRSGRRRRRCCAVGSAAGCQLRVRQVNYRGPSRFFASAFTCAVGSAAGCQLRVRQVNYRGPSRFFASRALGLPGCCRAASNKSTIEDRPALSRFASQPRSGRPPSRRQPRSGRPPVCGRVARRSAGGGPSAVAQHPLQESFQQRNRLDISDLPRSLLQASG
jgi:hypothetical protein